jgi:hypothetical protein
MHVWMFRRGDRFRIEVDGNPGILLVLPEWEVREGEFPDEDYERLCSSEDEVEIEVLHQDLWRSLEAYTP